VNHGIPRNLYHRLHPSNLIYHRLHLNDDGKHDLSGTERSHHAVRRIFGSDEAIQYSTSDYHQYDVKYSRIVGIVCNRILWRQTVRQKILKIFPFGSGRIGFNRTFLQKKMTYHDFDQQVYSGYQASYFAPCRNGKNESDPVHHLYRHWCRTPKHLFDFGREIFERESGFGHEIQPYRRYRRSRYFDLNYRTICLSSA